MDALIGSCVIRLDRTDSTNSYAARELLKGSPEEGTVYLANEQLHGRGQTGNLWESEKGENLIMSVVLYPKFIEIANQFMISKVISLGIADFIDRYTDNVHIKWPNDIYIGDKKVAGLLIENSIQRDTISSCVVGIGININQREFRSGAPNPVSLYQATGERYRLDECLPFLLRKLNFWYAQLVNSNTDYINEHYLSTLFKYMEWAKYSEEGLVYEGRIEGVDEAGRVVICSRSGTIKRYHFKEVEFVL